ncbi:C-type mannose receptor 2-like [Mya arenaria]|uniref:C-type mannose receptor 2-like n=1 Tax=Mya arenaria TaxID=6604 RepID=UPI0022E87C99|nr:C-type mannose receptor 2-like [Mya arenaria]
MHHFGLEIVNNPSRSANTLNNQHNCDALRYVAVDDVCQLINIDVDGSSVWNSKDNVWKVTSTGQNIPKIFTTQSTSPIVTSSTFGAITTSILTTTSTSTSETATTVPLVTTTPPTETTTPAAATTPAGSTTAATTPTPATTTTVVGTTAPPTCARGWQQYEGSCYLWVEIMYEWKVAKNNCESMGANLTSAANAGEDAFVYSIMGSGIWTSGNDMATEGTFMWSPHEAFTYINWSNNEPGGGTMENCMSIKGNTGRWADFACSQLFTSMCKKAV